MNREQAAEINRHLLDADGALSRSSRAIASLGKEERVKFDGLLQEVWTALQTTLLTPIYSQYPDLEPPYEKAEEPAIDSELRWDQVRLPPNVSEADIDGIIFSLMEKDWQKMAKVVGDAVGRFREIGLDISAEILAARLLALAEADRIEAVGDLRKWRFSEVRLRD
jgi:Protein of unknown function